MATNPVRMRDGDEGHKATTSEYRVDSADESTSNRNDLLVGFAIPNQCLLSSAGCV